MDFYGEGAKRRVLESAAVMCRPRFEKTIHNFIFIKKEIVLVRRI